MDILTDAQQHAGTSPGVLTPGVLRKQRVLSNSQQTLSCFIPRIGEVWGIITENGPDGNMGY